MSGYATVAAAVALAVGCSSGIGDSGVVETRPPVVTTAATSSTPVPTSRPASTTTSTPATLPPTDPVTIPGSTTSTTAAATTTTLDPVAVEEAAVTAAALEIQQVRMNAYVNLDAPGNEAALDSHYTADGVALFVVEDDLKALRDSGDRVRDNPNIPTTLTIEDATLLDGPPATRANVVACLIDSAIVYEPNGGPGGQDAVVNDDATAARVVLHLFFVDGLWKLDEVEELNSWPEETECPPA